MSSIELFNVPTETAQVLHGTAVAIEQSLPGEVLPKATGRLPRC